MMFVEVFAQDGGVSSARGSNVLPAFPAGTKLIGYAVNGCRFIMPAGVFVIADGQPMTISLAQIREAFRMGAPRTWKPPPGECGLPHRQG